MKRKEGVTQEITQERQRGGVAQSLPLWYLVCLLCVWGVLNAGEEVLRVRIRRLQVDGLTLKLLCPILLQGVPGQASLGGLD